MLVWSLSMSVKASASLSLPLQSDLGVLQKKKFLTFIFIHIFCDTQKVICGGLNFGLRNALKKVLIKDEAAWSGQKCFNHDGALIYQHTLYDFSVISRNACSTTFFRDRKSEIIYIEVYFCNISMANGSIARMINQTNILSNSILCVYLLMCRNTTGSRSLRLTSFVLNVYLDPGYPH